MLSPNPIPTCLTLLTWALLATAAAGAQTTWHVDDDAPNDPGPGDPTVSDPLEDGSAEHPFDAIQEAIDAATDGDEVLVLDGTYTGEGNKNLDYVGKAITVRSENGPATCIIDCEAEGRGFYFQNSESTSSVVDGFTITNGRPDYLSGGGIRCEEASPTIANCTITQNSTNIGGGISCYMSSPTITNCTITENRAGDGGGGIRCLQSSPTFINCTIAGNTASFGGCAYGEYFGCPIFRNCVIRENTAKRGGGFYCDGIDLVINNCVIVENGAGYCGGIYCDSDSYSSLSIVNSTIAGNRSIVTDGCIYGFGSGTITDSIIWANSPANTQEIYVTGLLTVTYCDIQGGESAVYADTLIWGDGNIDIDPLLTQDGTHLRAGSPCRDAGDPGGDYTGKTDIDGEPRVTDDRVDIGADEFADTDVDGLPDWWELCHFASPTGGDPEADDDYDGLTNLEEYAQSRHPLYAPATYYVDTAGDDGWNGLAPTWDGKNGPKATIQAAINTTHPYEGDEVSVADGIYTGPGNKDLSFRGKAIMVSSAKGAEGCIIDCENDGRGFYFRRTETADSLVCGFTIQNAFPDLNVDTKSPNGAVYCYMSDPTICDCIITGTTTEWGGAGFYGGGSNPTIINCIITGNTTTGNGGGVSCVNHSSPTIINCTITENQAFRGGGVYLARQPATITNCTIAANSAYEGGGAYCKNGEVTMSNCTISANEASLGGGLVVGGATAVLSNCILWADSASLGPEVALIPRNFDYAFATLSFSNVQGGQASVYIDEGCTLIWGDGNIDADPLFADPNDADYHLSAGSPCIDAGCNCAVPWDLVDLDGDGVLLEYVPFDLDGEGRFFDDPATPDSGSGLPPIVDMGAYEFGGSDLPPCHGDLDGDRDVDFDDLVVLLGHYGMTGGANGADGDMDCDGDVEISDLAELLGVYGTVCN